MKHIFTISKIFVNVKDTGEGMGFISFSAPKMKYFIGILPLFCRKFIGII